MRFLKHKITPFVLTGLMATFSSHGVIASSETAKDLNALLKQVESGRIAESKENKQRERRFASNKNEQKTLLNESLAEQQKQEALSSALEKQFDINDAALAEAEARLRDRMGSLGELFGHITSAAGDMRANIESSLVSVHYPDRLDSIEQLIEVTASGTELPSIEQIERLWFDMQREMIGQGQIVAFTADVSRPSGTAPEKVVRIGAFNMVSAEGEYMQYHQGSVSVLARQPASKYTSSASRLANSTTGVTKVGVDPTGPSGGSLLAALIDSPTITERWHQGGIVGYVITAVGVIAMILAILRIGVLIGVGSKVKAQLTDVNANDNNPLGRVLKAADENKQADLETLELKMNEAILKELPKLTTFEPLLKIIAAVAPLLGLLGTVTGMILTFQAITIYGAGDPKAMAGGISSALITTVLGLLVAIPTVLMHTIVSGRSKHIIHILEEQAAGIVAQHQEGK